MARRVNARAARRGGRSGGFAAADSRVPLLVRLMLFFPAESVPLTLKVGTGTYIPFNLLVLALTDSHCSKQCCHREGERAYAAPPLPLLHHELNTLSGHSKYTATLTQHHNAESCDLTARPT